MHQLVMRFLGLKVIAGQSQRVPIQAVKQRAGWPHGESARAGQRRPGPNPSITARPVCSRVCWQVWEASVVTVTLHSAATYYGRLRREKPLPHQNQDAGANLPSPALWQHRNGGHTFSPNGWHPDHRRQPAGSELFKHEFLRTASSACRRRTTERRTGLFRHQQGRLVRCASGLHGQRPSFLATVPRYGGTDSATS